MNDEQIKKVEENLIIKLYDKFCEAYNKKTASQNESIDAISEGLKEFLILALEDEKLTILQVAKKTKTDPAFIVEAKRILKLKTSKSKYKEQSIIESVREGIKSNMSFAQIALFNDIPKTSVIRIVKENNMYAPRCRGRRRLDIDSKKLKKMFDDGASIDHIAFALEISTHTVKVRLDELGLSAKDRRSQNKAAKEATKKAAAELAKVERSIDSPVPFALAAKAVGIPCPCGHYMSRAAPQVMGGARRDVVACSKCTATFINISSQDE